MDSYPFRLQEKPKSAIFEKNQATSVIFTQNEQFLAKFANRTVNEGLPDLDYYFFIKAEILSKNSHF